VVHISVTRHIESFAKIHAGVACVLLELNDLVVS